MLRRLHTFIRSALVLIPFSVLAFVFLFTFAPAVITRAARYDSGSLDFVVGVDGNIAIMLPKTDISFMIDASKNEIASQTIEIGVDSNLTHGVVLGMTTAYSNTSVDDLTGNGLNSVHSYTIPALDRTVHKSLFPVNHWGYSVDGGTYYNRMPAANDGFMAQVVIENPSAVDVQEIYIGAKADISQPLDYYYTTINFTAITNFAAKTIDDIIYMQEMTPEVVESMETNRQYRLRDSRDKKDYWIAKFDDGNVWMTQNLDLDLSPNLILTHEDSDLADRTWASTTAKKEIDYNLEESYNTNDQSMNYSHLLSNTNGTYLYNYTVDESLYGDGIDSCLIKFEDNPKFCNHFKIGQRYTWLEAVATNNLNDVIETDHGNISVDESICPKGWRLPAIQGDNSSSASDFPSAISTLYREYDTYGLVKVSGTLDGDLAREPYFFIEDYGYWSSSITSSNSPRYKNYHSYASTASYQDMNYVRCMARPVNSFMLEFDLNGGDGTIPDPIRGDSWTNSYTYYLPTLSSTDRPSKEGYSLVGWSTDPNASYPEVISAGMDNNGNIIYSQDGSRVTSKFKTTNRSTRLYAVWEQSIKLKFNANGGRFSGSLYSGETEDDIMMAYSVPLSGTIESQTVTYSSRDCNGQSKGDKEDTMGYCRERSDSYSYSFGSDYDYVDVTVYYAISGDSTLCVFNGYNNYNYNYQYCSQSISGNLADGAYFDASNHYTQVQHYRISNSNNVFAIGWRGMSNTDGQNSWYGFWVEAKAIKTNTNVQYRRSERSSISTPVREGYRFVGWSTNPSAAFVNWEYNSNMRYTQDVQLYAVWAECPIVTVAFVTGSSHVTIDTPTILWDTAKTISLSKNSNGQWYYYDSNANNNVIIATVAASSDRFYDASSSISTNVLTPGLGQDLNEGDTYTVTISYTEEPVENMHELSRESCALAPLNTTYQLNDARDNKKYWVTKLADGNCWMTQNLDLRLETQSNGGTTLYPETSSVTEQQTIYASNSWSTSTDANSYYDGGEYYYANGLTPTSTSGLAANSVLWHYHKGSYYNKKMSKMVCPAGWQLGSYKRLFNAYGINQTNAMVYTTVGNTPLQAPFYHILDYNTTTSTKPETTTNAKQYTKYWAAPGYQRDIISSFDDYETPLLLYITSTNTNNLQMITNSDRTYRYNDTTIYRTSGFVRCMR